MRPVYAPALVAWVGGPGFGVSFGIGGGVGWFPLGFGEPFVPWYHAGPGYWRNVNVSNTRITNVTVINNYYNNRGSINNIHYANRSFPNAVTAVPQRAFVNSQSVGRNMVPVSGENLRNAHIVGGAGFEPSRTSVLGANAGRAAAIPPQRAFARQPVRNMTPPSAPASPFNNGRSNVGEWTRGQSGGSIAGPSDNETMGGPGNGHQNVAETTNGRSVPRPPTVFIGPTAAIATTVHRTVEVQLRILQPSCNNNGNRGNNGDTPTRTPNTDAGRMPNSGQPNRGQPNGNQNVARPYPRPPSGGERQPMGNNPGNPQNQPAHSYTPSPSQNQGGSAHTNSGPPANQRNEATRLRQTNRRIRIRNLKEELRQHNRQRISRSEATRLRQIRRRIPIRSLKEELRQRSRRQISLGQAIRLRQTSAAAHVLGASRKSSGSAATGQPAALSALVAPANQKPEHERNNRSVYGGNSSGYTANNYSYPRPSPGAVRSAPVTNYSSGNSYSGSSARRLFVAVERIFPALLLDAISRELWIQRSVENVYV